MSTLTPFDRADCVPVLELPSRSDSLHFRAYAEPLAGGSLLDWAVHRLGRALPGDPAVYILVEPTETRRVDRALSPGTPAVLWPSTGRGQTRDLAVLAASGKHMRLFLIDLTAAVLPSELFRDVLRYHMANSIHATRLRKLPCATPPLLVDVELLSTLTEEFADLPSDVLPKDLRVALAGLEQTIKAGIQPASVGLNDLAPLNANALVRRRWPYSVRLDSPQDVETLRRVLDQCSESLSAGMTAELLDHWTEVSRRQWIAELTIVDQSVRRSRSSPHRKRRVLYPQNPSAFAGGEQVLVSLAAGICSETSASFEASALIAQPGTLTDRLAEAGADVRIAGRDFARNSVEHYVYSRQILEDIEPVLVHAHTTVGVPFCCAAIDRGLPFVQHVHVADERGLAVLADQIRLAHAVIAVSNFVKGRLMRLGLDPDRVHVIHNGVEMLDRQRLASVRTTTRRAWGVRDDGAVVLVVARFAANKRHDVALDAFGRLRERLPNAHLVFAGEAFAEDRPVVEAVDAQIQRLRVEDRVRRLGFSRDMASIYAAADLLLLPSEDDPLPLTVLEAMACGVPVVGARSGGIPEMIEHGTSGLLVEPGDADGFATALAHVLTEEEQRAKLVSGGLVRCRTEFSLSRFVGDVVRLYERVLAENSTDEGA